ncbi:Mediator of RNA polymerase II transcription subunit 1 isoform 2 [Schistosoma japonicum]|uniref:Mediator of RNA polymerase II transcription subunit 1 isoform 2 n=1 Tax=Schistosoma japonicum TaxID=6182 RepID=A0A4Z2D130_SCHJA|nr:Mediator of RNA polymerase II transcription subunit 1 isoform 2 [Schistosoma japonicum]
MRDLVNRSLVGHFVGRTGGRLARLTYLVTSAQAMISNANGTMKSNLQMKSKSAHSISIGCGSRDGLIGGYMARIGLCPRLSCVDDTSLVPQSTVQRLPFMPLVTLQKDAYGISVPHFAQPDEIKCISIEAEFVLHLDPPLPISVDAIQQLERTTGLRNTEIADKKEEDIVLLILRKHKQEHLYGINTHLQNPNLTQHSYQIKSNVKAYLVSSVPFTCSDQIGEIISILRKQASALAFYETFIVHPDKPVEKDAALTFSFKINIMADHIIMLEFDDPNHLGARIHASLHVRPFDVQCLKLNYSSNTYNSLNDKYPGNDEEVNAIPLAELDIESENNLKANFSKILTKTHTLPIGFVWLLTQLQCPIHKQLGSMKLPVNYVHRITENNGSYPAVSQKQLISLRAMLNRAKSSIIIRGSNGTGGVLCGGDRKVSLDFESSSFAAAQVFALNTPNYLNGAKRIPPLPPGVMATPPPAFNYLDAGSGDLGLISSLRPMNSQGKLRDIHSNPNLSVVSTNPSRGLRLDDLLVDSTFQTQQQLSQHDQQRNPPPTSFSHSLSSYSSIPGTHNTSLSDMKDSYCDIINPNISISSHPSLPSIHSSHKYGSSILSGTNNISNLYSVPSICMAASNSEITSSLTVTKSKSFIASPINDSSRAPTSGSMLVNLLNEDSLSTSVPLTSPSSVPDRHHYASSHSLTTLQSSPLAPGASGINVSASRLPGIIVSNNSQPPSSDAQLSQVCGKLLSSSAPNLTVNNPQYLSVRNSNLITPNSGRAKHANVKNNQSCLTTNSTANPKKPRKRHRGAVEGGFRCISGQKSNTPVPGVYSNYPTTKHQRTESVLSASSNSLSGIYQRPNFNQTNPNFVSCSLQYAQQSTQASVMQSTSLHAPNPSKSVYDFDDNPGSVFDIPVGNISSSNSLSFSSGSSLTSPKSSVSVNPSQSGSLTVSSTNAVSNYPVATTMSSNSSLERTVERKTSLKMTIKTIPSQPITSTPKGRVNFGQNDVDKCNKMQSVQLNSIPSNTSDSGGTIHPTHSLSSVKKRKKRSVEGKPSAYMLQMLQIANSSISPDPSITTSSIATSTSGVPSQSVISPVVLNNPNVKHIKSTSKLVGHGSVLVKKERKRRLGHGFTEKTHFSFIPSSGTYSHLQQTTDSSNIPKLIKINRVSRPPTTNVPKDTQVGSGTTSNLYNNYMSMSPNSASSKKKMFAVGPTSLGASVGTGSSSDDVLVPKRFFSSTASSLVNSDKRKRNPDTSKQSISSQYAHPSSSTSNDSSFIPSPLPVPTSSDAISNNNAPRKAPRPSMQTVPNLSRAPHIPTNRSQLTQQSNTSNYLSSNSTCAINPATVSAVGSSSGLIKGYKIPKKKSMLTGCLPNIPLSDGSGDKSASTLSNTLQQIQENVSSYRDTPDSQSPEKSDESSLTIVENLYSSSNDPNPECVNAVNPTVYNENISDPANNNGDNSSIPNISVSGFTASNVENCSQTILQPNSLHSGLGNLGQCSQSSQQHQQQQLPRKSSVKSISDIVDKLRAKSTTSISSSTTSTMVSCSSDTENSDLTVVTSCEAQDSTVNSVLSDNPVDVRSIARKNDDFQDQWRDNIFEKFCPSGTPTPHQGENGQNNMCKSDSEVNLSTSVESVEESMWTCGTKESVYDKDERNPCTSNSNALSISDSDGKQDKEQFEFIKANTDTPASPTEFSTTVPTCSTNVSSKIIPISPTSMKCLSSTGSIPSSTIKPNIVRHSSLRFEKKSNSGRFSRLGANGMILHGSSVQRSNSDSYSHSGGIHGHSNRLPRGGMNNLDYWHKNKRHNKAPNFKPPSNWGPVNLDYGNMMGIAPSSSSSSAPGASSIDVNNGGGNMGHWMMPPGGGNLNQNNPNMMQYNNPHAMQHHPYHSALNSRPMRPGYNVNGTTGHNPYNTGMMRGNKK